MSFWRKDEPIVEGGRIIRGGMWPHQREWFDSTNFIKALVTGYGGGKTLIGSKWSIAVALHNAPVPFMAISPSYKQAKKTTIATIKELLNGRQRLDPDLSYKFNKQDNEFLIDYHGRLATIWIGSGDDPDSLKGPNIGAALIDEPFIQDRAVFEQMIARIRHPAARIKQLGLTGTPEDLNWGYDICEGEDAGKFDLKLVQASTRANKALGSDYADRLESALSETAAKAYVDGGFVALAEGRVYYAFDRDIHVKAISPPIGAHYGVGMDFNVNPMSSAFFWMYDNHIHIYDEIEQKDSDTDKMCAFIRSEHPQVTHAYPDASGNSRRSNAPGGRTDFSIITSHGLIIDAPSKNPLHRDRYNIVNGRLKPRQGEPTLTIDPRCKKLIRYLEAYAYDRMKQQDKYSHLLDAAGYPICRLTKSTGQIRQEKIYGA